MVASGRILLTPSWAVFPLVGEALIKSQLENAMLPGLRAENQLLHQETSKLKVAPTSSCAVLCINHFVNCMCMECANSKEQATGKSSPETKLVPPHHRADASMRLLQEELSAAQIQVAEQAIKLDELPVLKNTIHTLQAEVLFLV